MFVRPKNEEAAASMMAEYFQVASTASVQCRERREQSLQMSWAKTWSQRALCVAGWMRTLPKIKRGL